MLVFMMLTAVASAVAARNARRGEKFPGGASHTPRTPRHGKVRPQLCCELGWVGIAVFSSKNNSARPIFLRFGARETAKRHCPRARCECHDVAPVAQSAAWGSACTRNG